MFNVLTKIKKTKTLRKTKPQQQLGLALLPSQRPLGEESCFRHLCLWACSQAQDPSQHGPSVGPSLQGSHLKPQGQGREREVLPAPGVPPDDKNGPWQGAEPTRTNRVN